eukprot:PhF_6_TR3757/c1_g1_i1/m.5429
MDVAPILAEDNNVDLDEATVQVKLLRCVNFPEATNGGYIILRVDDVYHRSNFAESGQNVVWNESYTFTTTVHHSLQVEIYGAGETQSLGVGTVFFPRLTHCTPTDITLNIMQMKVYLTVTVVPHEKNTSWMKDKVGRVLGLMGITRQEWNKIMVILFMLVSSLIHVVLGIGLLLIPNMFPPTTNVHVIVALLTFSSAACLTGVGFTMFSGMHVIPTTVAMFLQMGSTCALHFMLGNKWTIYLWIPASLLILTVVNNADEHIRKLAILSVVSVFGVVTVDRLVGRDVVVQRSVELDFLLNIYSQVFPVVFFVVVAYFHHFSQVVVTGVMKEQKELVLEVCGLISKDEVAKARNVLGRASFEQSDVRKALQKICDKLDGHTMVGQ